MIESSTILAGSGLLLVFAAVGFALATRWLSARARRFGYGVVLACGAMGVAYLLMAAGVLTISTSGREESVVRFLGYTVALTVISFVLGALAGASRRHTLALVVGNLLAVWGTLGSWVLGDTGGAVAAGVVLLSFGGVVVLLLGPVARTAATAHPERTLLYSELRNLVLLAWAGLIVLGIVSEQNLALTDGFTGQIAATYVDVVLLIGFGGLVFRNVPALEATVASSAASVFDGTDATGQPSSAD